jgi:hypothetical protein
VVDRGTGSTRSEGRPALNIGALISGYECSGSAAREIKIARKKKEARTARVSLGVRKEAPKMFARSTRVLESADSRQIGRPNHESMNEWAEKAEKAGFRVSATPK